MKTPTRLTLPGKIRPYLIAHRGNRVLCPENTLVAFRQALTDGADILETDLHLTADNEFVCIHDATVDRTTNGSGIVAHMTLAQIKKLSAAYHLAGFEDERIPSLSEVTAILPGDVALALELKTSRFLEPDVCLKLVTEINQAGVRARTILLSFHLEYLRAVQAVAADIPIGWITISHFWPLANAQLLGPFWPLLILNPFYIFVAHRRGQLVCPLDPNPDSRLWLYRRLGCDAILSDNPAATCLALKR